MQVKHLELSVLVHYHCKFMLRGRVGQNWPPLPWSTNFPHTNTFRFANLWHDEHQSLLLLRMPVACYVTNGIYS